MAYHLSAHDITGYYRPDLA